MGQKTNLAGLKPAVKNKDKNKRYASRFGQHYSIVRVPTVTEVINGIPVTKSGKTIEFKNGIYDTSDPEEQNFLETSGYLGIDYVEVTKEIDSALKAKSLAEKEMELKAREEELNKREIATKGQSEGAETTQVSGDKEKNKKKQPKF